MLTRAYCTYVRPILEYCSPVWSPHNEQLITKIERVQTFFTKTIPGLRTLPYRSRLQKLGLKTLEHRRLIHDLCLCYKIVHEFIHCIIQEFPVFISSRTRGHMWSYVVIPSVYAKKMLHYSQSLFLRQSNRETLELSASKYHQLVNPY